MDLSTSTPSRKIWSRIAGISYIFVILLAVLKLALVESQIIVPEDALLTTQQIVASEGLFRIGMGMELLMYLGVALLSVSLFVVTKSVNRNLSLLGIGMRLGEAVIGGLMILLWGLVPLFLIEGESDLSEVAKLVGVFVSLREAGLSMLMTFMGIGGTVFLYLFYRARLVPRWMAVWGMWTYVSTFFYSFAAILFGELPEMLAMLVFAPGTIFEFVFGIWLLVKGVKETDGKTV